MKRLIYELKLTKEESRNYNHILCGLKALSAVDYINIYISIILPILFTVLILWSFEPDLLLEILFSIPVSGLAIGFLAAFFISAVRRSKRKQMAALLNKYLLKIAYPEAKLGNVKLLSAKVVGDKMRLVYAKYDIER